MSTVQRFIDRVLIDVAAGHGGPGCISFHRAKYVPKGGPDGGDGGRGGHVILRVDAQLGTLLDFTYRRHYAAKNGDPGTDNNMSGADAADLIVTVPPGTVVYNAETDAQLADLVAPGEEIIIAKGGIGGRGNQHFATPTRQAPRKADSGRPGVELQLRLELKLIAEVGLVGLPNAGKSTMLSTLTLARPKIAAYPFTTLSPNLGVVRMGDYTSFVLADIPGLVEGASEGRGLGHEFLRHIERTRVLLYLVDLSDPDPASTLATLRAELTSYSRALLRKPCAIAWNKADLFGNVVTPPRAPRWKMLMGTFVISGVTGFGVEALKRALAAEVLKLRAADAALLEVDATRVPPPEE